jgi:hypothetical protein
MQIEYEPGLKQEIRAFNLRPMIDARFVSHIVQRDFIVSSTHFVMSDSRALTAAKPPFVDAPAVVRPECA